MIKFKLNGKSLSMPSNWYDLTFDQYVKVMSTQGTTELISLFTGVPVETLKKAKFEGLELVIASLSFLNTEPKFDDVVIKIGKYDLPINSKKQFNIQQESLEQFEDMRKIILSHTDDKSNILEQSIRISKSYGKYVAIYLQKIRDKEYNFDKAMAMMPEINLLPAHQVIALGSFFFRKQLSLLPGIQKGYQSTTPSQKKKKPVSAVSRKRSARSPRSRK
jgi:hypothetical protein